MYDPKEVDSLTFSLLFTPEMVHHIPIKIHQPEGLYEIRVICPYCTGSFEYRPIRVEQNPKRLGTMGTMQGARNESIDLPTVTLKEHRFTRVEIGSDFRHHGWVWINRCMRCNHLLYASKWKAETAIDQILGNFNA